MGVFDLGHLWAGSALNQEFKLMQATSCKCKPMLIYNDANRILRIGNRS